MKGREPIVLASQPDAPSSPALSAQAIGYDDSHRQTLPDTL